MSNSILAFISGVHDIATAVRASREYTRLSIEPSRQTTERLAQSALLPR
ncbi:hypothetical protein QO002_001771 [Pararhizobium capsulatum DSM 1112]|uniref:Uncharacterized protein n=1 Tax=Pararhizobium capsulatum DSM 1112 TaxID=1121113 RepID=A0ABU0BMZ9_9HYPH|nr:hypothetical protein [Pararhizobium capsulatum]MDQ0319633.1 hypothetical protein [Pararhizobium capsulatum DSM 1112]